MTSQTKHRESGRQEQKIISLEESRFATVMRRRMMSANKYTVKGCWDDDDDDDNSDIPSLPERIDFEEENNKATLYTPKLSIRKNVPLENNPPLWRPINESWATDGLFPPILPSGDCRVVTSEQQQQQDRSLLESSFARKRRTSALSKRLKPLGSRQWVFPVVDDDERNTRQSKSGVPKSQKEASAPFAPFRFEGKIKTDEAQKKPEVSQKTSKTAPPTPSAKALVTESSSSATSKELEKATAQMSKVTVKTKRKKVRRNSLTASSA